MNQTRCIVILSILALFVASVSVAGNISLPDASQKVFEGKPCKGGKTKRVNMWSA